MSDFVGVPERRLTCAEGCEVELVRVSGTMLCRECGKCYYDHPYCRGQRMAESMGGSVFLHVACDGRHLKL